MGQGYLVVPAYSPSSSPPPQAGEASEGLLIVAVMLQAVVTIFWIYIAWLAVGLVGVGVFSAMGGIMLALAVLGAYLPAQRKQFASAAPVTLVLAILGFFLGFVIVGIPYLLAYLRIVKARDSQGSPQSNQAPASSLFTPPLP